MKPNTVIAEQITYQAVESFLISGAGKSQSHGHATAGDDVNLRLAKRNKTKEKRILAMVTATLFKLSIKLSRLFWNVWWNLKADTHEGFCSRVMLLEQSSSMCSKDFIGIIHPRKQNYYLAKCSTILNRFNIWEQNPVGKLGKLENAPSCVLYERFCSWIQLTHHWRHITPVSVTWSD